MNISNEKIQKLIDIARLYYEEDKTQSEIASIYHVSRPLISRMLKEAREYRIVRIDICSPLEPDQQLLTRMKNAFPIRGGVMVPDTGSDNDDNDAIAMAALDYMASLRGHSVGIGWGHVIGNMIRCMESGEPISGLASKICPLVGNSGVGNRNYHSDELVRIFALQTGAVPEYLYAPALVLSEQELSLLKGLENYKNVFQMWKNLDIALVNVGNYPSVPDFASAARYGDILTKQRAIGKILNYYYDIQGKMFHSDMDYMVQIPLEVLEKARQVVGICSANTKPEALIGALRAGVINHVIAKETTVRAALELKQKK